MDATPGHRIPNDALRPRGLAPGEYGYDPRTGCWFVRPPEPGYLQALNRETHPVIVDASAAPDAGEAPITVGAPIIQAHGAWRLEDGQWHVVERPDSA